MASNNGMTKRGVPHCSFHCRGEPAADGSLISLPAIMPARLPCLKWLPQRRQRKTNLAVLAKLTKVPAAVLIRADGQGLLGQGPEGKPWAGWWEFPGGKIETGESPIHGLQRALHEELGLTSITATPWLTRSFSYPEKTVKLHF